MAYMIICKIYIQKRFYQRTKCHVIKILVLYVQIYSKIMYILYKHCMYKYEGVTLRISGEKYELYLI